MLLYSWGVGPLIMKARPKLKLRLIGLFQFLIGRPQVAVVCGVPVVEHHGGAGIRRPLERRRLANA